MGNISGKLNLAMLKHAMTKTKNGQDVIVIPVKDNDLFLSEKGNVYLDIQAYELKNPKEGSKDTHIVKQSFSKEVFEKMTDDEKKKTPIIGNLTYWSGGGEPAPNVSDDIDIDGDDENVLPF